MELLLDVLLQGIEEIQMVLKSRVLLLDAVVLRVAGLAQLTRLDQCVVRLVIIALIHEHWHLREPIRHSLVEQFLLQRAEPAHIKRHYLPHFILILRFKYRQYLVIMQIIQASLLLLHLVPRQLARSRRVHARDLRVRALNGAVDIGADRLVLTWHVVWA